jgi:hypothetical protein
LITAGLLALAVFPPSVGSPSLEYVGIGLIIGTVLGHATLAGLWTAMGPLSSESRLLLSLTWLAALLLAFSLNLFIWEIKSVDIEAIQRLGIGILLLGGWLVGQWVVVQLLTWGVMHGFRLQLAQLSELRKRQQPAAIWNCLLVWPLIPSLSFPFKIIAVRHGLDRDHEQCWKRTTPHRT